MKQTVAVYKFMLMEEKNACNENWWQKSPVTPCFHDNDAA